MPHKGDAIAVRFYVSKSDYRMLNSKAEEAGVSLSVFLRELICSYTPIKLERVKTVGRPSQKQLTANSA